MRLYLVRHAHAVPEEENARRPLSARGRKTVRQIAAFFRANGALQPGHVWHSPHWRARETAEIQARGLGLSRTTRDGAATKEIERILTTNEH